MNAAELRNQAKARADFEDILQQLHMELQLKMPLRILNIYVRYLEDLIERTGGNQLTNVYRVQLCEVKKAIANRSAPTGHLHLVKRTESN